MKKNPGSFCPGLFVDILVPLILLFYSEHL